MMGKVTEVADLNLHMIPRNLVVWLPWIGNRLNEVHIGIFEIMDINIEPGTDSRVHCPGWSPTFPRDLRHHCGQV